MRRFSFLIVASIVCLASFIYADSHEGKGLVFSDHFVDTPTGDYVVSMEDLMDWMAQQNAKSKVVFVTYSLNHIDVTAAFGAYAGDLVEKKVTHTSPMNVLNVESSSLESLSSDDVPIVRLPFDMKYAVKALQKEVENLETPFIATVVRVRDGVVEETANSTYLKINLLCERRWDGTVNDDKCLYITRDMIGGLMIFGLLLLILFVGMSALINLQTPDRFEVAVDRDKKFK
eukprot:TRINITY_DN1173_c0_g1_i1.p1 TRINITY_DN1173_c0_g1~~TRINITY_DN1173_c0_g1_i1.p1  ORF type:complete len:231 (-),score=53.39 TRINITY_DN1173_c0_g1_i1:110-802(-)